MVPSEQPDRITDIGRIIPLCNEERKLRAYGYETRNWPLSPYAES